MINYNYELDFLLEDENAISEWIERVILSEGKSLGELSYIFMTDDALLEINKQYLYHDYYTDIISFDYTEGNLISGDLFISVDRIKENAINYNTSFNNELLRVMIHGVLHYCGYKDKTDSDELLMRNKENEKLLMFHEEH